MGSHIDNNKCLSFEATSMPSKANFRMKVKYTSLGKMEANEKNNDGFYSVPHFLYNKHVLY